MAGDRPRGRRVRTGGHTRTEHGLDVVVDGRVATVTLDRPERLNALSTGLQGDLVRAFDGFDADDDVWAVVLTGAGDRAFSAGVDLKEVREADTGPGPGLRPMAGFSRNVFETVLECGKPTVARSTGGRWAAAASSRLACDVRLAAEHARIGLPEAKRGMGANFGVHLLSRIVPRGIAYELLYTGDDLSAARRAPLGPGEPGRLRCSAGGRSGRVGPADRRERAADRAALQGRRSGGAGSCRCPRRCACPSARTPTPAGTASRGWPRSWRSGAPVWEGTLTPVRGYRCSGSDIRARVSGWADPGRGGSVRRPEDARLDPRRRPTVSRSSRRTRPSRGRSRWSTSAGCTACRLWCSGS
ncbi:enoyl-CoA hydratase/isomerase family protein [Pseudonocardia sp. UM4_GMWB1]|uniref:enoyl-CoA hydratase/isomerase family protein n=1 Tax=Pseudonocardia sp. UM4_GMWB1 TaxID=2212989 RepID=UPI003FD3FDC6